VVIDEISWTDSFSIEVAEAKCVIQANFTIKEAMGLLIKSTTTGY